MKYYTWLLSAVSFLYLGCTTSSTVSDHVVSIQVIGGDKSFEMTDVVSRTDTIRLVPKHGCVVGDIQDYCLDDSLVYVLDNGKSLFSFQVRTGKMENYIHHVGHGRNEYIAPKAVCVRNGFVYLLDFQGKSVLMYDRSLTFLKRVTIPFTALDFSVVSDGFLFFNLNRGGIYRRVVYTDFQGQVKDSFLDSDGTMDYLLNDKVFSEIGNKQVYYTDFPTGDVYYWNDKTLEKVYALDFVGLNRENKKKSKGGVFSNILSDKYLFTQYLSSKMIMSNVYLLENGKSKSGPVATHATFPFLPQVSWGNQLIGVYEKKGMNGYMLVKYLLK